MIVREVMTTILVIALLLGAAWFVYWAPCDVNVQHCEEEK